VTEDVVAVCHAVVVANLVGLVDVLLVGTAAERPQQRIEAAGLRCVALKPARKGRRQGARRLLGNALGDAELGGDLADRGAIAGGENAIEKAHVHPPPLNDKRREERW
jgi:hypothetical protein